MAGTKKAAKKHVKGSVACWEDDPGDPKQHPPLVPIQVSVPNQSATPLPFKISDKAPSPEIYNPGTKNFLYYAAASALRRTADFWSSILATGTHWHVGATLPVHLDSGVDLNAFYTRGGGGDSPGLHFFHDAVASRAFFSGESPDVACHEMGHAVLDAIRPELFDAQSIEAAAFHESFGDMSAMLSALQVSSFRDEVLKEVGGTLNRNSRLSRLAEQLGAAVRVQHPDAVEPDCLRNAVNSFFYRDPQTLPPSAPASQLSSEPHSFSRLFTAAFLDALAAIFKLNGTSSAELLRSTSDMAHLLVGGVLASSVTPDYYAQVAAGMVQFGETSPFMGKYRDALQSAFVRRGILSLQAATTLRGVKVPAGKKGMMAQSFVSGADILPIASISAVQYGLKGAALNVHIAAQPKRYGVTSSSLTIGPLEPRSAQSAAESYTEDLFQRGHVDVGSHAHPDAGFHSDSSFKTHQVSEQDGELLLKRICFDCGFDHSSDRG